MDPYISHAIDNIKASRKEIFIQILLIFIFPVIFIHFGLIPIGARVPLLVLLVSVLAIVVFREKWTSSIVGLRKYNYKKYFLAYGIFTLVGVLVIIQFGEKIGHEGLVGWWQYRHFLYVFFIVSAFQEIAYRGYLIPALGKLTTHLPYIVLTNALLFGFLHTIFPNPVVGLPLAFLGGLGFAVMYLEYPSLPCIIISHSILNFFAVLYGFFVIPGVTY